MHERPINQLPKPRIPKDKYENAISGGHKKCNPKNIWFNCKVRSSACQINQYIRRRRRHSSSRRLRRAAWWLVLFRPNDHNVVFKADRLLNFCRLLYGRRPVLKIRCLHTKCMVAVMVQYIAGTDRPFIYGTVEAQNSTEPHFREQFGNCSSVCTTYYN